LVPRENVTRTHVLKPPTCRCCGKALRGEDPEPYRHQVVEVPKVVADVDEYQFHTLTCDDCGVRPGKAGQEGWKDAMTS